MIPETIDVESERQLCDVIRHRLFPAFPGRMRATNIRSVCRRRAAGAAGKKTRAAGRGTFETSKNERAAGAPKNLTFFYQKNARRRRRKNLDPFFRPPENLHLNNTSPGLNIRTTPAEPAFTNNN